MRGIRNRHAVIAAGGGLFVLLCGCAVAGWLDAADTAGLSWVRSLRRDSLAIVAAWITNVGSVNFAVPSALVVAAILFCTKKRRLGLLFGVTILWYPVLLPVRILIDRPTPDPSNRTSTAGVVYLAEGHLERLGQAPPARLPVTPGQPAPAPRSPWYAPIMRVLTRSLGRSFPSNHAAVSAYLFGLCGLLAWLRSQRTLGFACAALIALIGVSRVYMGVHYPSDVLASWSLVAAVLALALPWLIPSRPRTPDA